MSAKPSPLPDPDLSPTKGETQDRRKVGLEKGPVTIRAQRKFDVISEHEDQGDTPLGDTIVDPNAERDPRTLEQLNLKKPTYKYGDKVPQGRRSIPIPQDEDPRHWNKKLPVSAKSGTSKSAKKPDNHSYKVKWT